MRVQWSFWVNHKATAVGPFLFVLDIKPNYSFFAFIEP